MKPQRLVNDKPGLSHPLSPSLSHSKPRHVNDSCHFVTSDNQLTYISNQLGTQDDTCVPNLPNRRAYKGKSRLVTTLVSEKQIETHLTRVVSARGGLCWKLTSPGTAGVPDRIILFPSGRVGFVELKAPAGKIRAIQKHRLRQLNQLGFLTFIINDPAKVEEVCDAIQAA